MTDKEIASELGIRFIKAKLRVTAMSTELDMYRDSHWNHLPWRTHVDETIEQSLASVAQDRIEELQIALDGAKAEAVLHTLHKFLSENF